MKWIGLLGVAVFATALWAPLAAAEKPTYAERLGWPKGSRVAIFHVDDAGMHHDANVGTIRAIEEGIATSASIMMPCPWVPEFIAYVKAHPETDAGVHCTLNSEWRRYKWRPLADKAAVPGLQDPAGYLWAGVHQTALNATPDEFEREIRAQAEKAIAMGIQPTHLDTHMGTVFWPPFLYRYTQVGMDMGIPVMIMGGHMQHIGESARFLKYMVKGIAKRVWDSGLPVLDDLVTDPSAGQTFEERRDSVIEMLRNQQPGLTQYIVHCTEPSPNFGLISGSGGKRKLELEMMCDPKLKQFIEDEGIILTTWRELKERRDRVGKE